MLMRCSIALENLSRTIPPIDEDENVAVHHAPFKGTTLSGGELAKLQKANTEHASALTMFPAPAAPPSHYVPLPYTGEGKSFRKGGYPQRKSSPSRNQDKPTPSATITKLPKTSDSQTTMNKQKVQSHDEAPRPKKVHRGRGKGNKKQSE